MTTLNGVAYLPAGWSRTELTEQPGFAYYTEPRFGGHVTVDYNARVFRLGISTIGPVNSERDKRYCGRGWRNLLELDAAACLHRAVDT